MNIFRRTVARVIIQLKEHNLIDVVQQGRGLPPTHRSPSAA